MKHQLSKAEANGIKDNDIHLDYLSITTNLPII